MWIAPPLTKERLQMLTHSLACFVKARNIINPAKIAEIIKVNKQDSERAMSILASELKNLKTVLLLNRGLNHESKHC